MHLTHKNALVLIIVLLFISGIIITQSMRRPVALPFPSLGVQPPAPISPPVPTPPAPVAVPVDGYSPTELKFLLIDQFGPHFYCDSDTVPVARQDEEEMAIIRFAEIQSDHELFSSILNRLGMIAVNTFSDAQKLLIYRHYKDLRGVMLEEIPAKSLAPKRYAFGITNAERGYKGEATRIEGIVTAGGIITVASREPYYAQCPICLAKNTLIETSHGKIAVQLLQPGMNVWTTDASGKKIAGVILKISSTPVRSTHKIIHLLLRDGRELFASPGHPLADGRLLGNVAIGDFIDGVQVKAIQPLLYSEGATYDILPSGPTGAYWANDILIGSTLR